MFSAILPPPPPPLPLPLSPSLLLLLLPIALCLYIASTFLTLLVRQRLSPLHSLPGPPSPSFFLGNLREMHDQENNDLVQRWSNLYGSTFVYRGFLNGCRLMTTDPVAVSHILSRGYEFPKPDFVRNGLASMIGGYEGILVVEGEDHRRQRKVLTPAFTAAHIRSLSPIFWEKAVQLRDVWLGILSSSDSHTHAPPDPLLPYPHAQSSSIASQSRPKLPLSTQTRSSSFLPFPNPFASFVSSKVQPSTEVSPSSTADGVRIRKRGGQRLDASNGGVNGEHKDGEDGKEKWGPRVDVLAWFARATLDVIGEAGFGYAFNSLSGGKESELAQAFGVIFSTARKFRVITILQVWFPILRSFQRHPPELREAHATMNRIGLELINQKRAEVLSETPSGSSETDGRDLLSVLIRSNLSSDPEQRLSTNETLCQISTFIAAGHETTASALTWAFYALARAPDVQRKLRAELRTVNAPDLTLPSPSSPSSTPPPPPQTSPPPPEELSAILSLSYLDAVVRESLRLHAPVTSTMRVAACDNVIPLSPLSSSPSSLLAKPQRRREETTIRVNKGDIISIPISALNQNVEEWGEDGRVFRPERWIGDGDGEGAVKRGSAGGGGVQGLWGNMLTFLNGNPVNGNRACIGWRFAVNEIKMFLYVLVRDIEFSIDPTLEVEKKVNVVTRPWIKSEPHLGNQMPLHMRYVPPDLEAY